MSEVESHATSWLSTSFSLRPECRKGLYSTLLLVFERKETSFLAIFFVCVCVCARASFEFFFFFFFSFFFFRMK